MDLPPASPDASLSSHPSSPLQPLSRSPTPPSSPLTPPLESIAAAAAAADRYPSPTLTSSSASAAPSPRAPTHHPHAPDAPSHPSPDGPPPAKKRKTMAPREPKDRTTRHLDLTKPDHEFTQHDQNEMERLLSALHRKKKIVVVAGAGISVSAGIPDFRSANGLFATAGTHNNRKGSGKHLFDASVYKHGSSTSSFHNMVREMATMSRNAKPTPFHHMLASLAADGRLLRLYSQNIDCLDTSLDPLSTNVPLNPKGPWPTTIQLHGGLHKMVCTKCGDIRDFQPDVFDGPETPLCQACVEHDQVRTAHAGKRSHGIGRLRPRFVLYNEYNPDEEAVGAVSSADLKSRPDAVIVVGTTLKVPGTRRLVKELCQVARGRRDGFTAWINIEPEPKGVDLKDCWDLVVRSKCDSVAQLASLPPWDCRIGDDYLVSSDEDRAIKERLAKIRLAVDLPTRTRPEALAADQQSPPSVPTPTASPTLRPTEKPATKNKKQQQQSKLSFAKGAAKKDSATATKAPPAPAAAIAGKRGRKPKAPAKAPQKTLVKDMYKVGKAAAPAAAQDKLAKAAGLGSLPALRPDKKPASASACSPQTPATVDVAVEAEK